MVSGSVREAVGLTETETCEEPMKTREYHGTISKERTGTGGRWETGTVSRDD